MSHPLKTLHPCKKYKDYGCGCDWCHDCGHPKTDHASTERFTEDSIRRDDLPRDVFGLLHDLCYHHDGRDVQQYVKRAQAALSTGGSAEREFGYRGGCNVCRGTWAFNKLASRCPYCIGERVDICCEPIAAHPSPPCEHQWGDTRDDTVQVCKACLVTRKVAAPIAPAAVPTDPMKFACSWCGVLAKHPCVDTGMGRWIGEVHFDRAFLAQECDNRAALIVLATKARGRNKEGATKC